MRGIDFSVIIKKAWAAYDNSMPIVNITDVSARVSTNHVFKVDFKNKEFIYAKLSFFGTFEHFCEDHKIINILANNLEAPYQDFLARSLTKNGDLFTYRYTTEIMDVWVAFYQQVKIKRKLPRRLNEKQIVNLGKELALFHKACHKVSPLLPSASKTINSDIETLLDYLDTQEGKFEFRHHERTIRKHCNALLCNIAKYNYQQFDKMPVFVDWNIGNFSLTRKGVFYSRWDYDWFRIGSRVLDFYFFSRVTSDVGDRTVFSYMISPLNEERFLLFLKEYHKHYPLSENEVRFIKEAYRFFILTYVIKFGNYFFHDFYATKLQKEAFEIYIPRLDKDFKSELIWKYINK